MKRLVEVLASHKCGQDLRGFEFQWEWTQELVQGSLKEGITLFQLGVEKTSANCLMPDMEWLRAVTGIVVEEKSPVFYPIERRELVQRMLFGEMFFCFLFVFCSGEM